VVAWRITHPVAGPYDVEVELEGHLSAAELGGLVGGLGRDELLPRRGLLLLADLTGLDASDISDEDLQRLAGDALARDWDTRPRAVAIVAPDDGTFTLAMLYRAHLGGSDSGRRVFRTRAEAIAWLGEVADRSAG